MEVKTASNILTYLYFWKCNSFVFTYFNSNILFSTLFICFLFDGFFVIDLFLLVFFWKQVPTRYLRFCVTSVTFKFINWPQENCPPPPPSRKMPPGNYLFLKLIPEKSPKEHCTPEHCPLLIIPRKVLPTEKLFHN